MAKGYVIVTEDIKDQAGMGAYAGKALPTIIQQGGKPVVVDSSYETLEGNWHGQQTIVIEFESVDAAKAWYNSDEYQAVIGERHAAADSNLIIASGFEMPG